jgi:hypothetical protein
MVWRTSDVFARAAAGAGLAAVLLFGAPVAQSRANEFNAMAGAWTGTGTISVNNNKERLRCRANYNVSNGGTTVDLQIRCASDSYKFDLQGGVNSLNGNISGTWSESAHGAAGEIAGTVKAGLISARATGPYFSAHLSLRTSGNTQSISLNSPGSQISSVTMALSKGGGGPATATR